MTQSNASRDRFFTKTTAGAMRLASFISLYFIPIGIVLFSLVAILTLNNHYPANVGSRLPFHVVANSADTPDPASALQALNRQPSVAEAPVSGSAWLLFTLPSLPHIVDPAINIPSRHTSDIACWDAGTLDPVGSADRDHSVGALDTSKLGFALFLTGDRSAPATVLCRANLFSQGVLTVEMWSRAKLKQSGLRFARGIGLLEGGLLTISLFILVIALTNREWVYLLLAAWLVGNLRLGAQAMGWDTQWLGYDLPPDWVPMVRKLTIAGYYLLTYTLFTRLFRANLGRRRRYTWMSNAALWAGMALLAGAFVLPYDLFRPLMWAATGVGITVAALLLASVLYHTRSRVWLWHIVSLSMALSVMLSSGLMATFGRSEFIDTFNGVIALLLSNVMVALAVAERIREDRRERIRAQTELVTNYAVTPVGMFALNSDGTIERANPVFEQMLGISMSDSAVLRWTDFFEPQNWTQLADMTQAGHETEIKRIDAARHPGLPQHFVVRIALSDGKIEGSLQDVTARTETIARLRRLADNDPLTDVLNRRGIEKTLEISLENLAQGQPCALAYMDLEHFKRINGLFGHTAGDEVLIQVCQRIKAALTDKHSIGRIGGDEFIILFPSCRIDEARELMAQVVERLNTTAFHVGDRAFQVKTAVGVVEITGDMSAKDAISAASRACRDARKQHQDIVVYEQNSHELQEHHEELRLFDELEGGDSPRGLYLEMQPVMSLQRPLQTLNFEILLRVRDSTGALIPTGKIVAAAEESGTITIIDKWVFSATLEWLDKHASRLDKTHFVSINLSGVSLNDDRFVEAFFAILSRFEHLTDRLCVEITEGVALQDLDRTRAFMSRLQKMGARIALDDFGAGYTSFSYVKELPADAIKIDGALIKDMMANETNIAIVRTIVELARNLGMKSIAEWAEDLPTVKALKEMGVDYVQGFAISRPKSPTEILNADTLADLIVDPAILEFVNGSPLDTAEHDSWDRPRKLAPAEWL